MLYLLDTNILLTYLRGKHNIENAQRIIDIVDNQYDPFTPPNNIIISVVNRAELLSLARLNNWGAEKMAHLNEWISPFIVLNINNTDITLINAYTEIDLFSHGRHPDKKLDGSSRAMGKNDLWIAATALATGAELITTDNDFNHLDGVFFKVHAIK